MTPELYDYHATNPSFLNQSAFTDHKVNTAKYNIFLTRCLDN